MAKADTKQPADLVEVTVVAANHRHAGKQTKPGDKIKVHPSKVASMVEAGIVEKPAGA